MSKLIVIFLLAVFRTVHCYEEGGDNICQTEERFIELEEEKTTQPVRIRSYNWCLSFPPRCSNYRTEIRDVIKLQNVTKTKFIQHCCEGFKNINLINESIVCLPMCRGGCGHGNCESPNLCMCDTGYEGRHCSQRCRPRMYGKNCKNICKCRNNSLCDHKSGFCRCASGWIGEFCENPCPKGQYGIMCHRKCQCNNSECDSESGECVPEHAQIIFNVAHNRSSSIMKLPSDRIQAKHWIPVSGNGKINFRNCSEPDQCELNDDNGKTLNGSSSFVQNDVNKTALIQELNSNLSNLTKELKAASNKSVVIVNSSIAIHHIHKGITDAAGVKQKLDDLLTPSTEKGHIDTDNQDTVYDEHRKFEHMDEHIDFIGDVDVSDEIDSIGGYNDVVRVFTTNSINTTKSEQILHLLPPMVPVTLVLLIVMCVTFIIVFGSIYFIRKSKESQTQSNACTNEDITLSNQSVQKPLPEIPSFTQSITRRIIMQQQDFYDRPSNNKSVKNGLNELGYCYAEDENKRHNDERGGDACDEHIYDEIKYSNYRETTRR